MAGWQMLGEAGRQRPQSDGACEAELNKVEAYLRKNTNYLLAVTILRGRGTEQSGEEWSDKHQKDIMTPYLSLDSLWGVPTPGWE